MGARLQIDECSVNVKRKKIVSKTKSLLLNDVFFPFFPHKWNILSIQMKKNWTSIQLINSANSEEHTLATISMSCLSGQAQKPSKLLYVLRCLCHREKLHCYTWILVRLAKCHTFIKKSNQVTHQKWVSFSAQNGISLVSTQWERSR